MPDGGAFDGPLGVVSAFAAVDALRAQGFQPKRPIAVANFVDEEGARFGIACAGSRLITGALDADRARSLTDGDGVTMAEAQRARRARTRTTSARTPRRWPASARSSNCTSSRAAAWSTWTRPSPSPTASGRTAGGASSCPAGPTTPARPASRTGTTRCSPTPARSCWPAPSATRHGALATCGKVRVEPNGVNAIPSHVTAWLDARGPDPAGVERVVAELAELTRGHGGTIERESWTASTTFDPQLRDELAGLLGRRARAGHRRRP